MEIFPMRIFQMLICALCFGAAVGAINDANRLIRALMGERYEGSGFQKLRKIKLPVIGDGDTPRERSRCGAFFFSLTVFFQDVLLLFSAGLGSVIINYYFNDGRLRIYAPATVIVGFIIYYFTIGRAVIFCSELIIFVLRWLFSAFLFIFYLPIRKLIAFFVNFIKKMVKKLYKAIAIRMKKVYNNICSNIKARKLSISSHEDFTDGENKKL